MRPTVKPNTVRCALKVVFVPPAKANIFYDPRLIDWSLRRVMFVCRHLEHVTCNYLIYIYFGLGLLLGKWILIECVIGIVFECV